MTHYELTADRLAIEEKMALYRSGGDVPLNYQALKDACSMLHTDVLILLNIMSMRTSGNLLEVGPYLGGSTIALASGLEEGSGRKVVSIEAAQGFGHPDFPSENIIRDLRKNLETWGQIHKVEIVEGFSRETPIVDRVHNLLPPRTVSVCFLDADGHPEKDLQYYEDLLETGAYVLVDDFMSPGSDKGDSTREEIRRLEEAGKVFPYGIYGWGTWVGRYVL